MFPKTVISSDFSQKNCIESFDAAQDGFLNENCLFSIRNSSRISLELTQFSYIELTLKYDQLMHACKAKTEFIFLKALQGFEIF